MSYNFENNFFWKLVQEISNSWIYDNLNNLNNLFHENIIFSDSSFQILGEGRNACIKSYEIFNSNAKIDKFKQFNPLINEFGNTTIVKYSFEIEYISNNEKFNQKGEEVFIFSLNNNKWDVIWRILDI